MTQTTRITDDPRLYVQITEDLRQKIGDGAIQARSHASITDISQQWGVSRPTVRKALRILEGDGLVRRYPGMGYYVLPRTQ